MSPQALSDFLDRKPHLLRPLAVRFLPPPLREEDPAVRLGLDFDAVRTRADLGKLLLTVLAAAAGGAISPAAAARLARRGRRRLRLLRRLERLARGSGGG